ncbi:tetratricopeptide repeat protein [Acinetobacter portensis]|uniref:Tetratricopeptide repeat protein n=2 Tax=Acinetobacter TaxID=469 RepID=A0AB35UUR4_9GAMM|nr:MULTISPECIES: tetratricopeptide repeat protein [Acinetobacter]MCK7608324.1 tetratricopeptide repeat protein [Acinetobacter portensis]MCK7639141.1 tetratricopeptide repeat protein [Acinetobacter portensis]MDY6457217.1 tetratricopeptide repeat protein [Acinetobacter faecalis]MDY6458370.1 tetratricopeptide repeat protein [Acinetobacter faecalis]MDY6461284.1 tetratricopeptide repeat protein [Acinetobacter faecalis]
MRQINSQINGVRIKQYSTTILLIGSMFSVAQLHAAGGIYHANSKNNAIKQSMIAEFAIAYHDIPTALHNYTVLAIKGNSTSVKQRALNIAIEQEDLSAALEIATHWVLQEPKDVPALFYLSHIALKSHEYELAAETLDKILKIDPNAELEEILASISPEQASDREDLIRALKTSSEKNNPSILVLIAGLKAQNGQLEDALDTINLALKKRPKATSYILMKANLLNALGDQQATLAWYEKASKKYKNNYDIQIAGAKFLVKQNRNIDALNRLENIIKKWPKQEEALFIAGLTSIDLKEYEKAEKYLVELRSSNQYQNEAYYYLAVNAERKEHYETAKAYYRLVDGSLYSISRRSMISIFAKQNQLSDALRFLTQERVNYPHQASFLYQAQAEILMMMNNKKAALRLLDEAIKNIPDDPELIYAEVLLLDAHVDKEKLDKLLQNLLEIEPNNPAYLNAYAYTLALQNRNLKEARQIAEHAADLAPEQASILDTLGYITYLQNDFSAAAKALKKAYELSTSVKIGVRYAMSLYMQGKMQQFEMVLQELQTNHRNDPQLEPLNSLLLPQQIKKS